MKFEDKLKKGLEAYWSAADRWEMISLGGDQGRYVVRRVVRRLGHSPHQPLKLDDEISHWEFPDKPSASRFLAEQIVTAIVVAVTMNER